MFSRSTDGGGSWSTPLRINEVSGDCLDRENTVHQAVPAVGPDGGVYVCWSGPAGIVVDVSMDQGKSWLDHDIFVSEIPGGRPFPVLGFCRGGCLPMIACDRSQGPHRATVYVHWPDQRNGPDDTDIWLSRSTDNGMTWSDPLRVNDDPPGGSSSSFPGWPWIRQPGISTPSSMTDETTTIHERMSSSPSPETEASPSPITESVNPLSFPWT